jgi:hypothetical protein
MAEKSHTFLTVSGAPTHGDSESEVSYSDIPLLWSVVAVVQKTVTVQDLVI